MTTEQVSMTDWTKEVEKRLHGQSVSDLDRKHLSGLIAKVLYVSRPNNTVGIAKDLGWQAIPIDGVASLGATSNPSQNCVPSSGDTGLLRVSSIEDHHTEGRISPLTWNGEQPNAGVLHFDPWAYQVRTGNACSSVDVQSLANQSGRRPITIDSTGLVLQGATPVDELSWVLSSLTEWHQVGLLTSMEQVWIQVSLDALLFENVAKCRALRRMLEQWCHEMNIEGRSWIHGESTLRMFTLIDPNVNLLRSTIAAVGGIWGGVDGLSIHPYDVLQGSTEHSRRIATNIHRVLSEESGLGQWMDPLEGSYAVEHWTEDLCEMAWAQFAKDESMGGIQVVIDSGIWTDRLRTSQDLRTSAIQQGQVAMTGVNTFANAAERLDADWLLNYPETMAKRDSEDLERFRVRVQCAITPSVQILCLEPLSKVKRQVDMANQFMATMGWTTEVVSGPNAVHNADIVCICGMNETNQKHLPPSLLEDVRCILVVEGSLQVAHSNAFILKSRHPNLQLWSNILATLEQSSDGEYKQ